MDTFPNDESLQAYGCDTLRCLADRINVSSTFRNRAEHIGNKNGILTILNALDNHLGSRLLQAKACWALTKLPETNVNNRDIISENDGIKAVTFAIHLSFKESTVLEYAFKLFSISVKVGKHTEL
jgi:hypothetical protein